MTLVTISQARQTLPTLIDRILRGEEFLIKRNKIIVARISPVEKKQKPKKKFFTPKAFGMWKDMRVSGVDFVNNLRANEVRSKT